VISHKYKFLSIRIPKTASTSVTFALNEYFDIHGCSDENSPYRYHSSASRLKEHFNSQNWNFDEYFKFAFVRNPWDRFVSNCFFLINEFEKEQNNPTGIHPPEFLNKAKHIASFGSFKKIVMDGTALHTSPTQYDFLKINDSVGVDFIGKTENLQEDFNTVCDKIGIPQQKLPHANSTKHKHYTEYYDDETRQIVAEKYAKDIEYFGYKFGE
tara:strand:+ start:17827 stop:18462 length:636 start_codon:yes stop_codon:yes gene_type:complete